MKCKCLSPVQAWICGTIRCKADGLISQHLVFSSNEALEYFTRIYGSAAPAFMQRAETSVPCGKCAACQIQKRKEWTTRLAHEASCFEDKCCFITLTYDAVSLPVTDFRKMCDDAKMVDRGDGELPLPTLLVADVQKFLKRLRRHLEYQPKSMSKRLCRDHVDTPIRYYCVGEYGGRFGRPHYHLLIFGWKPSDMTLFQMRNGHAVYRSAQIEKLWRYGFSTVEPVEGGVAKYCSRYVTKKFARLNNTDPFKDCVLPEFCLQSVRHGGIGATWYDRNYLDMFERRCCSIRTGKGSGYVNCAIPKYYLRRARRQHPQLWLQLRDECIRFARAHIHDEVGYDDLIRSVAVYNEQEKYLRQFELF